MVGKRAFCSATLVATIGLIGAGPAWAAGETNVTYTGSPGAGSEIVVKAAPGKANATKWDTLDRCNGTLTVCIRDTAAGIIESSPHCTQESPTEVSCQSQGLRSVTLLLGDGPDVFKCFDWGYRPGIFAVAMGPGNDRIMAGCDVSKPPAATADTAEDFVLGFPYAFVGGAGSDRIFVEVDSGAGPVSKRIGSAGGAGDDTIRVTGAGTILGGRASDILRGGIGPQRIFGGRGNDRISCGKGKDTAYGGPGVDRGRTGCEAWDGDYGWADVG